MIPLDVVLDDSVACCGARVDGRRVILPEGGLFTQTPGFGWKAVPYGHWPTEQADSWICFQAAEKYRNAIREDRGY